MKSKTKLPNFPVLRWVKYCLALLIIILCGFSCEEEPPVKPPPPNPPAVQATLTLQDESCTEFWLRLELENFTLPVNVQLLKDNLLQAEINGLNSNDTTFYIDSLLPSKTYNFIAVVTGTEQEDTSNQVQATTLDTTSHFFSYQTFELGEPLTGNSSILYDVALINANNMWAVGEIYVTDSIGQTVLYNAVHWDGVDWELKKIYFPTVCGQPNLTPYPSRSIYAFDDGKIWMGSSGDKIAILENGIQTNQFCLPASVAMSINRIWGKNSNNLYIVGNSGKIAHYQNGIWQQISSGTDFPLIDIYSEDGNEIYISGAYTPETKGVLLKGNSNGFSVMINSEIINENELFQKLYGELASVWIDENNIVYTGGNLLFRYKNNEWNYETSLPENYIGGNPGTYYRGFITSIRGNSSNDYIIAGDRNTLKHFNGVNWQQIGLPYSPSSPIIWGSVKMKNNTAVAVGLKNNSAYIILLNR
jgi:hypothetical protein